MLSYVNIFYYFCLDVYFCLLNVVSMTFQMFLYYRKQQIKICLYWQKQHLNYWSGWWFHGHMWRRLYQSSFLWLLILTGEQDMQLLHIWDRLCIGKYQIVVFCSTVTLFLASMNILIFSLHLLILYTLICFYFLMLFKLNGGEISFLSHFHLCFRHTYILSNVEKQKIWAKVEKLLTDSQVEVIFDHLLSWWLNFVFTFVHYWLVELFFFINNRY